MKNNVVIGFLGTQLDAGKKRRWRPSISLTQQDDFPVTRLELIHDRRFSRLAHNIKQEVESAGEIEVLLTRIDMRNPWDFQEVYGALFDFARDYGFDEDREDYHVHLTTGTHVAQICWFLLTESRHIPAKLLQTSPPSKDDEDARGKYNIVDLDLSRYNALQQRFDLVSKEHNALLKSGIQTRNKDFNALIERIEQVATTTNAPILLQGDTGTGKSELANKIYELKLQNRKTKGRLVHVNCSTLKGDRAISTLFGHRRGGMSNTPNDRRGLLREADGGVLFLDEIDEFGLNEQAMILHAIETGKFYPMGSDHEITSKFQLIVGTNRDLGKLVSEGKFRADLYARLNLWTFNLPSLSDRREDIEPNIEFELGKAETLLGTRFGFNSDAAQKYIKFAIDPATPWVGNFRDLSSSIMRLCTLAPRGRITSSMVDAEILSLQYQWASSEDNKDDELIRSYCGTTIEKIDPFDRIQLAYVIRTCQASKTLSDAGRTLFSASRIARTSKNDSDRLRKYLEKFDLSWEQICF